MRKMPSVIQLPGGVKLMGLVFEVLDYYEDGSPKTFVRTPTQSVHDKGKNLWVLFGNPDDVMGNHRDR